MSEPVRFTVPGRPVPKARPRFANGRTYTPTSTARYERDVAMYARAAGLRLRAGDQIRVRVEASYSKGPFPDGDNVLKGLLDGLQKGFPDWNDRDVVECSIIRCVGADEARVLVEVVE